MTVHIDPHAPIDDETRDVLAHALQEAMVRHMCQSEWLTPRAYASFEDFVKRRLTDWWSVDAIEVKCVRDVICRLDRRTLKIHVSEWIKPTGLIVTLRPPINFISFDAKIRCIPSEVTL